MSDLLGAVAGLTGCRDRDPLTLTMACVLFVELKPQAIDVDRCIGEPPWLLRLAGERAA